MLTGMLERDSRPAAHHAPSRWRDRSGADALARIGPLEVRLTRDPSEIAAAQEVRFRVFYDELGARQDQAETVESRDADRFDPVCDHLVVLDTSLSGPAGQRIVGTYRLLRQENAASTGFYSQNEFDLEALTQRHPHRRFLELGRSCVLPQYRGRRIIELLWQGVWAYARRHRIDVMTGCASLHGSVPAAHAEPLSYLAQNWRASAEWDARAQPARYRDMDLMPAEAVDPRSAIAALPPLVKAYLRLGARIGDGCVVDDDFGTTDIFIILPVEAISPRYLDYYGASGEFAA